MSPKSSKASKGAFSLTGSDYKLLCGVFINGEKIKYDLASVTAYMGSKSQESTQVCYLPCYCSMFVCFVPQEHVVKQRNLWDSSASLLVTFQLLKVHSNEARLHSMVFFPISTNHYCNFQQTRILVST